MKSKMTNHDIKVAVISGGTGYLGSSITQALINSNFIVVVINRNKKENTTDFINNQSVQWFGADITNYQAVEQIAKKVKDQFGVVSTIIHAASAPLIRRPMLEQSLDDFEWQFKINVIGAFNLFKYFCPIIIPGGTVIGITSKSIDAGITSLPSGSYIPAKYALRGLLRVLSNELKDQAVGVYGVAPAFMPGGLNRDLPDPIKELLKKKSKPQDITTPEEVAETVLRLINDKPQDLNGKSITIPGLTITNL